MPGVVENKQTQTEISQEQSELKQKQNKVTDDLLSTIDLPADNFSEETENTEETEETSEEDNDEVETNKNTEDEEENNENQDEEKEVSKLKKTIEKMHQRINDLTAKSKRIEQESLKSSEEIDPTMKKLENMGETQLQNLKKEARKLSIRAYQNNEDEKGEYYNDLEDKIEQTLRTAPDRFRHEQVKLFQEKSEELAQDPDFADKLEAVAPKILKIANEIYAQYPKLHNLKEGQAIALELASKQFKEANKMSAGKDKQFELNRKINQLKKKTSLDTTAIKGKSSSLDLKKLQDKAFRGGDSRDKENLIKADPRFNIDALIPEEYK